MAGLAEQTALDFSESGVFARAKDFEFRPQQQQMAVAVAEALETESPCLSRPVPGSASRSRTLCLRCGSRWSVAARQ